MTNGVHQPAHYHVSNVERYTALALAVAIAVFCMAVIWRNKPVESGDAVVALRILLSVMCGVLGGIIPGFLNIDFSKAGLVVRAAGGLGLAVLTFVYTPDVIGNLKTPTDSQLERFQAGDVKVALDEINGYWNSPEVLKKYQAADMPAKSEMVSTWMDSPEKINKIATVTQYINDSHSCVADGRCDARILCPALFDEADNFLIFFGDYLKVWASSGYEKTYRGAQLLISCDCIDMLRAKRCGNNPTMCNAKAICQ